MKKQKKLLALVLTFSIISFAGCNKVGNTSSGVGFASSEIISSSEEMTSSEEIVSSEVSSEETSTETKTESSPTSKAVTSNKTESKNSIPSTVNSSTNNSSNDSNITNEPITLQLNVPTTYYGYPVYFCLDIEIKGKESYQLEALGMGNNEDACWGTSEYTDVITGEIIRWVYNCKTIDVNGAKDIMYNHVYPVGAGKTLVKAVGVKNECERFDQPLEKYIIFDIKRDTSSYGPIRKVVLYTTAPNTTEVTESIKKEIKTVFYKNFGHYSTEEPEYSIGDIFRIDNTEKHYRVFEYYLEEHYSLSEEECPSNTFYQHAWLADNSGNKIAGSDEYMDMGKVYDKNGNLLFNLESFSIVDFKYWSATQK